MSYLEYFKKPIDEIIEKRVSCRTYRDQLLTTHDKQQLLDFCKVMNKGLAGEKIAYSLAEFSVEELKEKKIAGYILFKNARSFIVGVIDKSEFHHTSYGYVMEHVVLKATEIGLGTCWAGYFDPYLIKDVQVARTQFVPAICLVGYAAERKTIKDKIARFALRASKRQAWDKLFFLNDFNTVLTKESAMQYAEPLELLRRAPSAGNTQPWRIVKENDRPVFHFFKKAVKKRYEQRKLHDIDIGIAMCHFELGAALKGLRGRWGRLEYKVADLPEGTSYMISWTHD